MFKTLNDKVECLLRNTSAHSSYSLHWVVYQIFETLNDKVECLLRNTSAHSSYRLHWVVNQMIETLNDKVECFCNLSSYERQSHCDGIDDILTK